MCIAFLFFFSNPQQTAHGSMSVSTDMDPRFRIILQEKEQTGIALQETVEVHTNTHTHTHKNTHTQIAGILLLTSQTAAKKIISPFWCSVGEQFCHTDVSEWVCVCVCVCVCAMCVIHWVISGQWVSFCSADITFLFIFSSVATSARSGKSK